MKILIIASAVIAGIVRHCLPAGFEEDSVTLEGLENTDLKEYAGFLVSNQDIKKIGAVLDVLDSKLKPTWKCVIHNFNGPMDNDAMDYMPWQRSYLVEITDLTPATIAQALIKARLPRQATA